MLTAIFVLTLLFARAIHTTVATEENPDLQALQEELNDIEVDVEKLERQVLEWHGLCDVYNWKENSCFFAIFPNAHYEGLSQDGAIVLCNEKNAKVADIYSENHYNDIMDHLRQYKGLLNHNYLHVRTAMQFSPQSSLTYLSDDTAAPFVKWSSSFPYMGSSYTSWTSIVLYASTKGSSYEGMRNVPPTTIYDGVVCQIKL